MKTFLLAASLLSTAGAVAYGCRADRQRDAAERLNVMVTDLHWRSAHAQVAAEVAGGRDAANAAAAHLRAAVAERERDALALEVTRLRAERDARRRDATDVAPVLAPGDFIPPTAVPTTP